MSEWANRIAYRGDDDGLWSMNPDGGDRHLVHLPADTGSISYDTRFVWSPDGSRIAFVRNNGAMRLVFSLKVTIGTLTWEESVRYIWRD